MTSLPDDRALYHMRAKVYQRSKGVSAVARAAYRSATCITDHRIGQTFDYRRKHCLASVILAPAGAPAWVQDREALWNACEAVERANGVVGREVEISIPRDIPESEWQAFAEEIVAPYVEAGAVVDVATHVPSAADKNPNPHFHISMTTRALDATQPHGFAPVKNAALIGIFESGGRHGGGKKGDALRAERERLANIANQYLERAGSPRRCTHKSWADLGIEREPEPHMGEQRMKKVRRQGKHDPVTRLVSRMRQTRILENELARTEEEIMAIAPKYQTTAGGLKPRHQQDFKKRLLADRFPDAANMIDSEKLHMIDIKQKGMTRVQTRDGGWMEINHATGGIRVWGQPGYADEVARAIHNTAHANSLERLEEMQAVGRKGGIQPRRKGPVPEQDFAKVESLADRWRSRGFTNVTEAVDGCWVHVGSCKIQDLGNQVKIHGRVNEDAVRAMLLKAADEWGAETEVFGTREFKDQVWIEAQRMGIKVYDQSTGELYEPSPDVKKAFEVDRKKVAEASADLETARDQRDIAELLKEAVSGDVAAIAKLENSGESGLTDFATLHLDDKQRQAFAVLSAAEIAEGLPAFRRAGIAARQADDARRGEASQAIKLETLTKNDDENDPVPEPQEKRRPSSVPKIRPQAADDDEMDLDAELARQEAQQKAEADPNYGF